VLSGAITADPLGVLVAFGAGILSFLSPCVLPLVPGYLSMVSGLSAAELGGKRPAPPQDRALAYSVAAVGAPAVGAPAVPSPAVPSPATGAAVRRPLKPLLRGILLFIAGFTLVFVALGAGASGVHQVLGAHRHTLTIVAGVVVAVLGVVMIASAAPASVWSRLGAGVSGRVGWLLGERRLHVRPQTLGTWTAPVMGMAFAFAWTPCIGPVLAAVLVMAGSRSTLAGGVVLLVAYSLGLGVPFVVTGIAFNRLTGFFARARRPLAVVQLVAGAVLVAFGAILLVGDLGWVSAQFSNLLDHLGLQRLTVS
jgi:cytochrome c-type biogenesis protein